MQICSKLLIEKMFYYKFFCQTIQCPKKEGGHNVPPSDVSPTKKHADVTRVKEYMYIILKVVSTRFKWFWDFILSESAPKIKTKY